MDWVKARLLGGSMNSTDGFFRLAWDSPTTLHFIWPSIVLPIRAKPMEPTGAPMMVDGHRQWVPVRDLEVDADDFSLIGEQFTAGTPPMRTRQVGEGIAYLMSQRQVVDYAVQWMELHRTEDSESGKTI